MITAIRTAAVAAAFALGAALPATAVTTAYKVAADTPGDQSYTGVLGMDFDVNAPIRVFSLGVFDDDSDGIVGTLVAELWTRVGNDGGQDDTGAKLATLSFSATSEGTLVGGSRFKALGSPLTLGPGSYSIVSYGYSGDDRNRNQGFGSTAALSTDDGGGLISFVGSGRFSGTLGSSIGTRIDGNPVDRYGAGTFTFSVIPVPLGAPLLASAFAIAFVMRRRASAPA